MNIDVKTDDLSDGLVIELLRSHRAEMQKIGPPEVVFALDTHQLKHPDITFWSVKHGKNIAGCIALKELSAGMGEIKSMKTHPDFLRRGVAASLLAHVIDEAKRRNYTILKLETGNHPSFEAAHALYGKYGFNFCGAFADYSANDYCVFMELLLD